MLNREDRCNTTPHPEDMMLTNLEHKSPEQVKALLSEFTRNNSDKMSFPELNLDSRNVAVLCFQLLQNPCRNTMNKIMPPKKKVVKYVR